MAKTCGILSLAKRIRQHPRARRGASLPLVLLLFLICAMASSIVLAAGTASAGRAAGLVESDQVYYSVSSSARLFRDQLFTDSGKTQAHAITIALSKSGVTDAPELTILLDGTEINDGNKNNFSILEQAAFFALFGNKTGAENVTTYASANAFLDTAAFFSWDASNANSTWNTWLDTFDANYPNKSFGSFSLLCTNADNPFDLDVSVEVDAEGKLLFKFRESGGADDLLVLTCTGDYSTQEATMRDGSTEKAIKAITVTWTPADIGKA